MLGWNRRFALAVWVGSLALLGCSGGSYQTTTSKANDTFSPATVAQGKYWVYFDPTWDWHVLDYANYLQFFRDTVDNVGPITASDNPDLRAFRDRGSKVVIWHGFADQVFSAAGSIDYYDAVNRALGGGYRRTQRFACLFLAPGVGHRGGGVGPQPQSFVGCGRQLGRERTGP